VKDFVLASGSAQRINLLRQIGFEPKEIFPADIDESNFAKEKPLPYVRRMALQKALHVAKLKPEQNILACDTVVCVGNRIIHKSKNEEEQMSVMKLLSGRTHKVISSVCLIDKFGKVHQRTGSTRITMKVLSDDELNNYIKDGEWKGVCGYKIEGKLAAYVTRLVGDYSSVVGLPLNETMNLLNGVGIR
jgi:septum formation protein